MKQMTSEVEMAPHRANGKLPQRIKCQIVAPTTVVLENGDVIVVQTVLSNVVRVVGQKDANGLQVYEFEMSHAVGRPEAGIKGTPDGDREEGDAGQIS